MSEFQIGEVFVATLRFVFKQLKAAFILAVVPYGLLLALTLLALSIVPDQAGMPALEPGVQYEMDGLVLINPQSGESFDFGPTLYFQLLMFLLAIIVPLPFKVAWLRYTLLGPEHQQVRFGYSFGDREFRFLGYTLGVTLVMLAIGIGGGLVAGVIGSAAGSMQVVFVISLAAVALLLWTTARLYFVFPAAVMDLPGGFRRAWVESRGQALKLIMLTAMILVVLGVPALLLSSLFGVTPLAATLIATVLQIIVDAGLWTALGLAYWKTTGIPGAQGSAGGQIAPAG